MLAAGKDYRTSEREEKIRERGKIPHRIKNPPPMPPGVIATLHEYLALSQMKKYCFGGTEETDYLFWKNQQRFLEFIDIDNPHQGFEKAKPGYRYSHAWFLQENAEFASRFNGINSRELQGYREYNWGEYNYLCERMHKIAPRYGSLEGVLIPINKRI